MSEMISDSLRTSDDHVIHYDLYRNGHRRVVIIAPGFFNSKEGVLLKELGQTLVDQYDVLIMDFRGHGRSSGLFHWTSREYLDLQAVLTYANTQYESIGVIGFSLGAATTIITASQTDSIDTVIAISAPTDFWKIDYRLWEFDVENHILFTWLGPGRLSRGVRPGPFWLKKEEPIQRVEQLKCPIFYIHGEEDWLITARHSEELYKKTPTPKRLAIIKNGPHAEFLIRRNKQEMVELIRTWLSETLPRPMAKTENGQHEV